MTITTAQGLAWLLGLAVPFATDLATKSAAPPKLKAFIAAVLAAAAGALPTVVVTNTMTWQQYVWAIGGAFAIAFTTHGTHVTDGLQRATASFGIGPSTRTVATASPTLADLMSKLDSIEAFLTGKGPWIMTGTFPNIGAGAGVVATSPWSGPQPSVVPEPPQPPAAPPDAPVADDTPAVAAEPVTVEAPAEAKA